MCLYPQRSVKCAAFVYTGRLVYAASAVQFAAQPIGQKNTEKDLLRSISAFSFVFG